MTCGGGGGGGDCGGKTTGLCCGECGGRGGGCGGGGCGGSGGVVGDVGSARFGSFSTRTLEFVVSSALEDACRFLIARVRVAPPLCCW